MKVPICYECHTPDGLVPGTKHTKTGDKPILVCSFYGNTSTAIHEERLTDGVNPEVGMRVTFNEKGCTRKDGVIVEKRQYDHYVHVRFDGKKFDVPCHPLSLEYPPQP